MAGHWGGPVTPRMFMDNFMSLDDANLQKMAELLPNAKFKLPVRKGQRKLEKHLYQLFEKTINDFNLSPNLRFFIGADGRPKAGDLQVNLRPDGGFMRVPVETKEQPTHGYNLRGVQQNLKIDDAEPADRKLNDDARVQPKKFDWFSDSLVVEFKKSHTMDPFYTISELIDMGANPTNAKPDAPPVCVSFAKITEAAIKVRGQLTMYAKEVFNHQFCTHIFQLLVCGRQARFIYWDHSGAVVSDSFDYVEDSKLMAEFFWRYNHMTEVQRGKDSSVVRATADEQVLFKEKVAQFLHNMNNPKHTQRRLPRAEETLDPAFPVYKITVVDDVSQQSHDILVQRPFFRIHSALGRATRGYLAYVIADDILKFFKDTWRVYHGRLTAERTLLRDLDDAGVPCIPCGVLGGDVAANGDKERTQCERWIFTQELSVLYEKARIFQHHRLLEELVYPINSAINSYEFVLALRDCLSAIEKAAELCGLLHRDISIGNVMITGVLENVRGILADWDHAAKIDLPAGSVHQDYRTGTWQFMSIALLKNGKKPHDILDDFESVYWTLVFGSLHWFTYDKKEGCLLDMAMFDEQMVLPSGHSFGGRAKLFALAEIHKWVTFKCSPLQELIFKIASELDTYYSLLSKCNESQNSPTATDTNTQTQIHPDSEEDFVQHRRAPPVPSQPRDSAAKIAQNKQIQKQYEEQRAKLMQPSTWTSWFDDALNQAEWKNDVRRTDAEPPQTAKQQTLDAAIKQLESHRTGEQLASHDPEAVKRLRQTQTAAAERTAKAMAEARAKADAEAALMIQQANMDSDNDDELESCIGEEDYDERMGSIDREFPTIPPPGPPLSDPPSPASTSAPEVPFPSSSGALRRSNRLISRSSTMASLRSGGPSRLPVKRSIDEVAVASGSGGEPPSAELPPPKKARSRSRARAATTRKTRTSSQQLATPPQTAMDASAAETKVTRPRRALKKAQSSADITATRPRREGLRPKPARSAQYGKN